MKLGGTSRRCRCSHLRRKRSRELIKAPGRTPKRTKSAPQLIPTCIRETRVSTCGDSPDATVIEGTGKPYESKTPAGCSSDGERASLLLQDSRIGCGISSKRWNALALFCALAFTQCCVGNTWGPIATSTMLAFPSWKKSALALLSNWGCIAYLSCCLPSCWFLNRKGLQAPLRTAAVMSTIATFIRCLTSRENIFTISVHLAAILNGFAGVIIGPAAALVSATWFPPGERTTATGISACFNQLGIAGSYLIGPGVVTAPGIRNTSISAPAGNGINATTEPSVIRAQVFSLMRIEFIVHCLMLLGFLCFFPEPQLQNSEPIRVGRYGLLDSLRHLIQKKSVWQLCGAAALSQGITGPWLSMITMAFTSTVTQDEADKLAFWTVILSSILSVLASRLMDIFQGHLKIAIFVLLVTSSIMFLWILLLDRRVLSFSKGELYTAVALGVSSSWATPALFLELASEIAFPVSEAIVGGYMIFLANFIGAIFYFSYFLPEMSERWSGYWVFGSLTTASILVLYVKEEYNRTPAVLGGASKLSHEDGRETTFTKHLN